MKISFLLYFLTYFLISCSGSKKAVSSTDSSIKDYGNYENKYYQKKANFEANSNLERSKDPLAVSSKKLNAKVNQIIQEYTGNELSEIARSDIFETKNGFEWKFTNVQTGQSYKINTNKDFGEVIVKRLTSLSDF